MRSVCSAFVSYLFIVIYSCQINHLKLYWTDLCPIFRIGMAVDVLFCNYFFDPSRYVAIWQPIFVGFIHRTDIRHTSGQ